MLVMKKFFVGLAIISMILGVLPGCEQEGPMEKTGEKMDEAIEDAGDTVEDTADEMEDAVEEAGDVVEETTDEMNNK